MREACFPFFGGYGQSSARKGAMSPGLTGATKTKTTRHRLRIYRTTSASKAEHECTRMLGVTRELGRADRLERSKGA